MLTINPARIAIIIDGRRTSSFSMYGPIRVILGITNLNIGTHRKPEIIEQIAPFSVNLSQNIARIITGQNVAAIPDQPKITNQNIVLVGEMSDTLTATIKEIIASVRVICLDSLIKKSGFACGLRIC